MMRDFRHNQHYRLHDIIDLLKSLCEMSQRINKLGCLIIEGVLTRSKNDFNVFCFFINFMNEK